jgi:uncharacterized protein (DUF885 family)
MINRPTFGALVALLAFCSTCSSSRQYQPEAAASETERLNHFFEEVFQARLDRDPERQSRMGLKTSSDLWTNRSDEKAREDQDMLKRDLARLGAAFDFNKLDTDGQLSHRLFEYESEMALEAFRWRFHDYPVNQMHGLHASVPSFLINVHRIDDVTDARAYIARLTGIRALFADLLVGLQRREDMGIIPPRFVFAHVLDDCRNLLQGAPFEPGDERSTLLADFHNKLEALELDGDQRERLESAARKALLQYVRPAYSDLIALLTRQAALAESDDGVWRLPDGHDFYDFELRRMTTTELRAEEIHVFGLSEVARIQSEMNSIRSAVGFEGDLQQFFAFVRDDARFYYSNDADGRAAYLSEARRIIAAMDTRLDELFITKPRSELVVKAVEPYREKSAGKAFYNVGAPDGSRPGVYYANLYDMADMPRNQMEALAYHEGIPGHHLQNSIAQELTGLPRFRKYGRYTAYGEGWGLYTELIPKQLGLYEDPYSDFGRLAMELWRACRLVVDTGIHRERWTRAEAIAYLRANTPNPEGDCIKAIERYIVMPGQATAYKIGMQHILELRARAEASLGPTFDIREFHDVLLTNGPLPLTLLEQVVDTWIVGED